MKNKISGSLDTNILLRLLLGDAPAQTAHIDTLFQQGKIFEVADAALIEMVFVLEKIYGFERSLISENVFAITRNPQCVTNRILFEHAMPFYVAHAKLSIIDCALLVYTRLNKTTPLYTFDKELIKHSVQDAVSPEK